MLSCTVSSFNIVLKKLAPCLFCVLKRDLGVFRRSVRFFVKWSTLTASGFAVPQHVGVACLSFLLRLTVGGLHT